MENIIDIYHLKKLAAEVNIWGKKSKTFTVVLPFLTKEENESVTTQVNKFYNTCGCGQGRVAGIFTLFAFLLLISTGIVSIAQWGIVKSIAGYFVISFIIMLFTKAIKLYTARRQFNILIANLESLSTQQ